MVILRNTLRLSVLSLTLLSLLLFGAFPASESAVALTNLTVRVMDVNDSGFIVQLPNGKVMVVDAGQSTERTKVYTRLDGLGITRIDYLVGTHQHSDHIANFDDLINRYAIGEVVFAAAPAPCGNTDCNNMKKAASAKGVPVRYLLAGASVFPTQTVNGLTLSSSVFAPRSTDNYGVYYSSGSADFVNSYSLVFNISYGGKTILFTGDITPPAQDKLMAGPSLGNVDVTTAPHHGYNTSTATDAFLNYLQSRSLSKIVIENQKDCGAVIDFKYRLKTRGTTPFWSLQFNHDFYYQTDGGPWTASVRGEWLPGDPVVAPPPDHACDN